MKKLLGILVLGLMWCNVGFAETMVCNRFSNDTIWYTFDFKYQTMEVSSKNEKSWTTNIVGNINAGVVFSYFIGENPESKDEDDLFIFKIMTTNLDNIFDIHTKTGSRDDFSRIFRKLDHVYRLSDGTITVPPVYDKYTIELLDENSIKYRLLKNTCKACIAKELLNNRRKDSVEFNNFSLIFEFINKDILTKSKNYSGDKENRTRQKCHGI